MSLLVLPGAPRLARGPPLQAPGPHGLHGRAPRLGPGPGRGAGARAPAARAEARAGLRNALADAMEAILAAMFLDLQAAGGSPFEGVLGHRRGPVPRAGPVRLPGHLGGEGQQDDAPGAGGRAGAAARPSTRCWSAPARPRAHLQGRAATVGSFRAQASAGTLKGPRPRRRGSCSWTGPAWGRPPRRKASS